MDQTRRIDAPEPCWARVRKVKGGPWVAARIWHGIGGLRAEINGGAADVARVWESGEFISSQEYMTLKANPPANPDQPIDIGAMPPAF